MEALLLVQAHRTQGGTERPGPWSEDRSYEQHPSVPKEALGEKWRKGGQSACTIFVSRVRTSITSFSGDW